MNNILSRGSAIEIVDALLKRHGRDDALSLAKTALLAVRGSDREDVWESVVDLLAEPTITISVKRGAQILAIPAMKGLPFVIVGDDEMPADYDTASGLLEEILYERVSSSLYNRIRKRSGASEWTKDDRDILERAVGLIGKVLDR